MYTFRKTFFAVVSLAILVSCSVISRQAREGSLQPMPFKALLESGELYTGKTVLLGGYILETENKAGETIIRVLQSPLAFWDEPAEKDKSEGRFIIVHKGFLDPEVYRKDRRITVAGVIAGMEVEDIGNCPYACLKIESREMHLWPEYEHRDYYPYYDDYLFYYPSTHPYYYRYRGYPNYYYPYYPYYYRYQRYPNYYYPYW